MHSSFKGEAQKMLNSYLANSALYGEWRWEQTIGLRSTKRLVSRCPLLVECQASLARGDSTDKGQRGCCRLSVECGP